MTKTIRLLRIQNNYLFKARKNTTSEFNFLCWNSTTFQVLLKLKTRKCEFVSHLLCLSVNSIVPFKVTHNTPGIAVTGLSKHG